MTTLKIYIAAEGDCSHREGLVASFVDAGHCVYDPHRPLSVEELDAGTPPAQNTCERFDPPSSASAREVRDIVGSEEALIYTYDMDVAALNWCNVFIFVHSTPSSSICTDRLMAAGAACAMNKTAFAYVPDSDVDPPEVWLAAFDEIFTTEKELAGLIPRLTTAAAEAAETKARLMGDDDEQ